MITFYKADETDFDNNGLGVLDHDIQNPDIEEKLNDIFTFSFNYPIFAVNGARLAARMIVKADDPENAGQLFRILKLSKSNGMLTAFCYHIFYDLNGNEIPDTNIVGQNGQTAITQMLSKTAVAHKFQGFSDIAETANIRVVRMSPVKFLIDTQTDNNFINRLGGEIRRVNYRIYMNKVRGSDNGATIRWKKSLDSYNATWDYTTVVTRIRPVGYNGIMLPESYVDSPKINDYETIVIKEIQYSDIKAIDPSASSNDEMAVPLEQAYDLMRQAAAKEFSENHLDDPTVTLTVNMVALRNTEEYAEVQSLETINPWDTVTVINERDNLSVKVRLNHYHYNPLTHKFISMELGNSQSTFTDIGSKVDHATNLANQANDTAKHASASADGKNTIYRDVKHKDIVNPVNGDTCFEKNGDKTELWQYDGKSVPPGWKLVVDDATGEEVRQNVDAAQKEAEEAKTQANKAVDGANGAAAEARFANDTATQAKSDAAAAKADAATAKGQATNALGQASTAIANAATAINAATDAQTKTNSLVTKVDDIAGTIKTLATTETVDRLAGTVSTTQSLAQFAADGLKLKADTTTVNQINGTVNDLKGELDVQADKIAATVTANDVTGILNGYATQSWSQGILSAAKNEITASVETVNQKVNAMTGDPDNLIIGGDFEDQREYIGKPSPYWSGFNTVANNGDKNQDTNKSNTVLQIPGLLTGNQDVTSKNLVAVRQAEYNISLKTRWISTDQSGQIIIYIFEYDANKNFISPQVIQIDKTPSGWKSVGATYKPSSDKVRYAALDVTYNGAKSDDVAIYIDDVRMRLALATNEWTKSQLNVAVGKISADVQTLTSDMATQTWTQGKLDLTADNLTSQISSVQDGLDTKYTSLEQTLSGVQVTANNAVTQSQYTQLAGQITSVIGDLDNLIIGGDFEDQRDYLGKQSPYWSGINAVVGNGDKIVGNNPSATVLQIPGLLTGNNDVTSRNLVAVSPVEYKFSLKLRWLSPTQLGAIIIYAFECDANKTLIAPKVIALDTIPMAWHTVTGTYTPSSDKVRYIKFDVTYAGAQGTTPIYVDDIRMGLNVAAQSQITQLQNDINLRVQKGDVINQINISPESILIDGQKVHITGQTSIDNAVIKDAMISNVTADKITAGTLNAANVNVINLNANNITTGTIKGANLSLNLNTGEVVFQHGRIHSASDNVDVNIDQGYLSTASNDTRVMLKEGQLQLVQPTIFDKSKDPYLEISNSIGGASFNGANIIARDYLVLANRANSDAFFDAPLDGPETFAGLAVGKTSADRWKPTRIGGAERGIIMRGGTAYKIDSSFMYRESPEILVGTDAAGLKPSDRIYINGSFVHIPSAYWRTASGSANLMVAQDGALVRSTSASKYKTDIVRTNIPDYGEKLLNLPTATWTDIAETKRYRDDPTTQPKPTRNFGMIAEDLADAGLEMLVVRGTDGELEGINYDRIGPALIPVIAKLKNEVETLKQKIGGKSA